MQTPAMKAASIYRGYRFPPAIIAHGVWLYHRFALSLRDVEDLLAERGVIVSYETIRQWCNVFGPQCTRRFMAHLGSRGDRWFLDEMVMSIDGKRRSSAALSQCSQPLPQPVPRGKAPVEGDQLSAATEEVV